MDGLLMLRAGQKLLDEFKKEIGEKEYNKIMESKIKGCKCGFIKEGNETFCPKCEDVRREQGE